MTDRVSCPYCNSSFVPAAIPPSRRLDCPRCGEAFALKPAPGELGDTPPTPTDIGPGLRRADARAPRSRRWVIPVVLGLGLLGLGIGFGVKHFRGATPPAAPEPDAGPNATAIPPAELAGFAYLPGDCNVVVAIQPGPLLAYAARTNQEPREMLLRAGLPAGAFALLDRAGVPLQQIDHLVLGVPVGDAAVEFRLTLALILRRPLADEEQFLQAMEAKKDPRGKPRHAVTLNVGLKLPLLLVRVSPTVWVFGNAEADLAPAERGGGGLAPVFRDTIATRIPSDAALWFATDAGKWAEKPLVKLGAEWAGGKAWLPVLAKGQAVAAGLSFGETPRARVFVRCVDEPTGAQLRDYFQSKVKPGVATGGGGEWAMYETPFDAQTGLQTLKDMLNDATK